MTTGHHFHTTIEVLLLTGILQVVRHQLHMTTEVLLHMQDKVKHLSHINIEVLQHTQDKGKHLQLMTTGHHLPMQDKGEHQLSVGMVFQVISGQALLLHHKYSKQY